LGGAIDDARPLEVDLRIADTRLFGGDYYGEARAFLFQVQPAELEDTEKGRIAQEFGLDPSWEFVLAAMSNRGHDHQILAELALHLATTYCGIIDFCGALVPPSARRTYPDRSISTCDWETIESDCNRWIASFPGKVIGLPYETARGTLWATHLSDPDFLRGWLRSPEFHMIK
jgi:hypothetical protein